MRTIKFLKMVASGNDFVIIDSYSLQFKACSLGSLAKKLCNRKYGVGADGLLLLEKSKLADIRMRIFNPDGTQAEMCGNGARCVALWAKSKIKNQKSTLRLRSGLMVSEVEPSNIKIETKAGILQANIKKDKVKIKMTEPTNLKLNIPVKINNRLIHANFIDTGVPHTVIFVQGLEEIDIVGIGRKLRYHKKFKPSGTNADFVEILDGKNIKLRTYERGVENETLACGTGCVASAIISNIKYSRQKSRDPEVTLTKPQHSGQKSKIIGSYKVFVHTKSGEILKVYFNFDGNKFNNVWLEGKTQIVYQGVYYV